MCEGALLAELAITLVCPMSVRKPFVVSRVGCTYPGKVLARHSLVSVAYRMLKGTGVAVRALSQPEELARNMRGICTDELAPSHQATQKAKRSTFVMRRAPWHVEASKPTAPAWSLHVSLKLLTVAVHAVRAYRYRHGT